MNKNIVFFDIDGTLLSEETKKIPQSAIDAIANMRKNGHLAFINTGRPISELTDVIKNVGFDGYVCGCGTYIEYKNEVLFYKSLGKSLSKEVAEDMKKYKLEGVLEGRYGIYYDEIENIKDEHVKRIIAQHKREGFYTDLKWDDENIEYDKFVLFVQPESDFNSFAAKYKDTFDFIERDKDFYEVIPSGYSKASGIQYLIEQLDIPFENTYALGDSTNDLSMLEYVKTSIAMGNSTPSLFDKVTYKTDTVDDNGVFNALKHFEMF